MTPPWLLLERSQETDEIADLPGVQLELGHAQHQVIQGLHMQQSLWSILTAVQY
jgi:hypothetical protein